MRRSLLLAAILLQALVLQAQDINEEDYISPHGDATMRRSKHADTIHGKSTSDSKGAQVIFINQDSADKHKNENEGGATITRYFSISTDVMQYFIFQPNVGIEYRRNNIAFGLNFGIVLPDPSITTNPFPTYQYEWPGLVYKGQALRLYGKWYFNPDNQVSYVSAAAELRFLSYNNVRFTDLLLPDSVTMNENAVDVGLDFLYGQEWTPFSFLHIDLFVGLGVRTLIRQYTVLSTNMPGQLPLGPGNSTVFYAAPIFGFKVGFNLFYKRAKH